MDSKKYNLNLDSEEEVSRLLTALPRVDAPSNFEFQVKAKIASGRRTTSWVERIPVAVRFALPTLLILFIGSYVYFYQVGSFTTPGQHEEAALPSAVPAVEEQTPNQSAPAGTPGEVASQQESTPPAAPAHGGEQDRTVSPAGKQNLKAPQGGSKDFAMGNKQVFDRFGAQNPGKVSGVNPDGSQLSVKQLLSPMGIETVYENGGYKVVVVTDNSAAMRSGIIKGDIVTAIGNQQLNQNSVIRGKASASQVTVVRGGKPFNIRLQPN